MTGWIIIGKNSSNKRLSALVQKYQGNRLDLFSYCCKDIGYVVENGLSTKFFHQNQPVAPPDVYMLLGDYDVQMEALATQLDAHGALGYNEVEPKRISASKMATAQVLVKAGVPVARTMPLLPSTTKEVLIAECGLPMVIKPDAGFGGTGVTLIHTEAELEDWLCKADGTRELLLAQQYIGTSKGRDVRVVMVNHKALHAVMRQAGKPDEFRSNVTQGGHAVEYEITPEIRALCEKASVAIGLDHCGLDLLFTENGFIIGEVNASPDFQSWYGKVDLMEMMLKDIQRKYKEVKGDKPSV